MSTRSDNSYLLGETSKPHTRTLTDPQQFANILTDIQDKLGALTQSSNPTKEGLVKLEIARESPKTEEIPLQSNVERNT